jgi:hypothetical protein
MDVVVPVVVKHMAIAMMFWRTFMNGTIARIYGESQES